MDTEFPPHGFFSAHVFYHISGFPPIVMVSNFDRETKDCPGAPSLCSDGSMAETTCSRVPELGCLLVLHWPSSLAEAQQPPKLSCLAYRLSLVDVQPV